MALHPPTDEQSKAIALFRTGESFSVNALAGTGKTSTLEHLAAESAKIAAEAGLPPEPAMFICFNKSIKLEAERRFPKHVKCSTVHSLAYQQIIGRPTTPYGRRLKIWRMKPQAIAKLLGIQAINIVVDGEQKRLAAGALAGHVMGAVTNFCKTADPELTTRHFSYIDVTDEDDRRAWANNREVHRQLLPFALKAWADINVETGKLKLDHGHYLKMWQLTDPVLPVKRLFIDEAQDLAPVMGYVAGRQAERGTQVIYVGDVHQQIYEFTGAINAMQDLTGPTTHLTQSFRFGQAVADQANVVLRRLGAEQLLRGTPAIPSIVQPCASPDAVLTRTNAVAVKAVLTYQTEGKSVHLIGGGDEVVRFAEASIELDTYGRTDYHELACFASWGEVEDYVENDPAGGDLALLVKLVNDFGAETIIAALGRQSSEFAADVIVSTAHKAKGREWDKVQLGGDFAPRRDKEGRPIEPQPAEWRLLYVAITRAKLVCDVTAATMLDLVGPALTTDLFGEQVPA